jgi:6-phosphogluconolactonase
MSLAVIGRSSSSETLQMAARRGFLSATLTRGRLRLRFAELVALVGRVALLGVVAPTGPASLVVPGGLAVLAAPPEPPQVVYVGTYTDGDSRGIYRFRFDDTTGRLLAEGLAAETQGPSFLIADPQGRFLFAVNESDSFAGARSGAVSAFAIDKNTGALSLLNQQASGGAWPCHLTLDASGRFLLVANYGGSATVLPVSPEGRLSPLVSRVDPQGRGPHERQDASHVHGVYLTAANRRLLVPDLGLDRVLVYRFDPESGRLEAAEPPSAALAPGAGPRHLAPSPDGRFVYVVNELDSTVTTLACREDCGRLQAAGNVSTLPEGFRGENTTAEIAVHPNGRFVYASNRGHDSLAVFAVDAATGALRRTAVVPAGGRQPRNFVIAPSGRWLLAAHQGSDTIAVFRLDRDSGRLTPVGEPVPAPRPVCLLFLPR